MLYDNDTFQRGGKTFKVTFPEDDDTTPPWERGDFHGPVSDWTDRAKRPGEWVLCEDHGSKRFYDAQEAAKTARREWVQASPGVTLGQAAATVVAADFEILRTWCADLWSYIGVVVVLLDDDEEPTDQADSIWGIESNSGDYLETTAHELADNILSGACEFLSGAQKNIAAKERETAITEAIELLAYASQPIGLSSEDFAAWRLKAVAIVAKLRSK